MTVRELESRMSARELAEWMAYSIIEPFGPLRDDFRAGLICATQANTSGAGGRTFKPQDFIPIYSHSQDGADHHGAFNQKQRGQIAMFKRMAQAHD